MIRGNVGKTPSSQFEEEGIRSYIADVLLST